MTGNLLDGDLTVEHLRCALEAGVPLRIAEYQQRHRDAEWLIDRAQRVVPLLAEYGTALMWRERARTVKGKRTPSTAEVCNALIEAVACAALVADGGIRVFGVRFDAELPDTETAAR